MKSRNPAIFRPHQDHLDLAAETLDLACQAMRALIIIGLVATLGGLAAQAVAL